MNSILPRDAVRALWAAAVASAATVAFDVAGRATRDALFVSYFGAHAVPAMVLGGSAIALLAGLLASRIMAAVSPLRFLQRTLAVSAIAMVIEEALLDRHMGPVSVVLYAHFTAVSGLLLSGFWTVVSERFDPRTARRFIPHLSAAGTFGGLVGGLSAARIAAHGSISVMLFVLAALNVLAAIAAGYLVPVPRASIASEPAPRLRQLMRSRYVQLLLGFVVLAAVVETLLDFVVLSRASSRAVSTEGLLQLFALFYTGVAAVAMVMQLVVTRRVIEKFGIAPTTGLLPVGVACTSLGAIILPGVGSAIVARGTELVLRNSVFRSSYELLFGAMPPWERRGAKTVVDVTGVRAGRMLGSGVVQAGIVLLPGREVIAVLAAAVSLCAAAVALLPFIRRRYLEVLEAHIVARSPSEDTADESTLLDTGLFPIVASGELFSSGERGWSSVPLEDRAELLRVLTADSATWTKEMASPAWASPGRISSLAGVLLDANSPTVARRRAAKSLGTLPVPEAQIALLQSLGDSRFEVRYHGGIALQRLVASAPTLMPSSSDVLAIVSREVDVSRPVWVRRELVAFLPDGDATGPRELLGEVLRERTERSIEHVFRLLALCLPAEPLRAALRGLQSDDPHVRGTALDYLEVIVPADIRRRLWNMLEGGAAASPVPSERASAEVDQLLKRHQSLVFRLDELARDRPDSPGGAN